MIDYFKKHSFIIMSYSLGTGLLLEWMTRSEWLIPEFSKWLIIIIGIIGVMSAIVMMNSALKKQNSKIFLNWNQISSQNLISMLF